MNKKTKIVAGLIACVCALSITAFAVSQWRSDIKLSGSVSAKGSWDVAVEAASVKTSSGAVLTYSSAENGGMYQSSYTVESEMNKKIAELENAGAAAISGNVIKMLEAYISYYDAQGTFHNREHIGYYMTIEEADAARAASVERITNAGGKVNSSGRTGAWCYTVSYNGVSSDAAIDGACVTYDAVEFNRPGAWAQYTATVTNNGTAAADLSDYTVEVPGLDPDVFTVDTPDLSGDVLEVGESCTFTVVVKVAEDIDVLDADAQSFTVALVYAPEEIEPAPGATHSH